MAFFALISFLKFLPMLLPAFVIASRPGRSTTQVLSSVQNRPQCIYDHFSALLELKTGLLFEYYEGQDYYHSKSNLSTWNSEKNRDCCTWEGITCDNATGHVNNLNLSSLNISGKFNFQSLSPIRTLRILDLASNRFSPSPIPSAIANLTSLTHLNLSYNWFYSQLPVELSSLSKLVSLDLSYNGYYDDDSNWIHLRLESTRALIQNMTSLRVLHLDRVDASAEGSDFGEAISSALPNLSELTMHGCNLSGTIHWVSNHTNLEFLDLSFNNLNGIIPSSLFTLPSLRYLILWDNQFGGQLSEFHNSSLTLKTIFLGGNKLQGMIPRSFSQLGELNFLGLGFNNFSGVLDPQIFLHLKSLLYLNLRNNTLEGSLPVIPPSIITFKVSYNRFSGEILISVCDTSSLSMFDISGSNYSGHISKCFGEKSDALIQEDCSLEKLDLSANHLKGKLPTFLGNCKHLTILNVGDNQVHDVFPSWVYGLDDLRIFILRSNNFYGPIEPPPTCQNFSKLQIFDLSFNNFTGSLPPALFCGWNKMTGEDKSIPEYIMTTVEELLNYYEAVTIRSKRFEMNLTKISTADTIVDLSRNQFQGPIPESIGALKLLWVLNMSRNSFTGQIPRSFENLRRLESLDLSQNHLSGNIPQELSELTFLEVLDLSENQFMGRIPLGKQFSTFTNESFQGNPGLCGPPLSKPCEDTTEVAPSSSSEDDTEMLLESEYDWKMIAAGFGIGYGVGMGVFCWTLVLWRRGRREYNKFVYKALLIIFPSAL